MPPASQRTFDRLFAEGREALLTGTQQPDIAPAEGGPRWGIAAVLRPDPAGAQALAQAAVTAADAAGDHGWLAGATHRSHLSLRGGLEPYRSSVPTEDRLAVTEVSVTEAQIVRWCHTATGMTPVTLAAATLPASPASGHAEDG